MLNGFVLPNRLFRLNFKRFYIGLIAALSAAFVAYFYHDQFVWFPDDGAYAYVASRLNSGDVLHRDIQEIHFGFISYVNALWLKIFGNDFLSLRYPLIFMSMVQAGLLASILRVWEDPVGAVVVVLVVSVCGVVLFFNPSANWYALFFFSVVIVLFSWFKSFSWLSYLIIGLLVGVVFGFRQISGVFCGIGCFVYVLYSYSDESSVCKSSRYALARFSYVAAALLILLYFFFKSTAMGFLIYGLWPILFIIGTVSKVHVSNSTFLFIVAHLLLGFLLATMPLVVFNVFSGSYKLFISDTFLSALKLTNLSFIDGGSYVQLMLDALEAMSSSGKVLGALVSIGVLLAPLVYGATLFYIARVKLEILSPVVVLPVFFMLISVHYEIAIYQYFSLMIVLLALYELVMSDFDKWVRALVKGYIVLICGGLLFFVAGRPIESGDHVGKLVPCDLPNCTLQVEVGTTEVIKELLAEVEVIDPKGRMLLTIPFSPELYFMSNRYAPVRFFNSEIGLHDGTLPADVLKVRASPLKVLVVSEADKYYGETSRKFVAELMVQGFSFQETIGKYDVYAR